jgi:hypothetical protein
MPPDAGRDRNEAQDGRPSLSSAARPRIGGIATLPSRSATLATVIAAVLPQVDRLYVYFDRHDAVPAAYAGHDRIEALLPAQVGDLASGGKFLGMALHPEPCHYFCFDDDIRYPADYVAALTGALQRHFLRAVVGLHGTYFRPPHESYRRDRAILHFAGVLEADFGVDLLGTGTIAFDTAQLRFDPRTWPHRRVDDLMVAIEAVRQGVPRVCIRRPRGFLQPLAEDQADSIHRRLQADDRLESEIMRQALAAYPLAWHRWG